MRQMTFGDAEYAGKRKKTRREVFLEPASAGRPSYAQHLGTVLICMFTPITRRAVVLQSREYGGLSRDILRFSQVDVVPAAAPTNQRCARSIVIICCSVVQALA